MFGRRNDGWIGVDVGRRAVKIAQLRRVGSRVELAVAAAYQRPAGSELADDLRSSRELAEGLRGSRAAATLSMADTLVESTGEQPPEGADVCWDRWEAGPASAYTLSTPATGVEATVGAVGAAGLRCEVIDGPPLAIARAARLAPGVRSDDSIGVLDWGAEAVTFVVARDGLALYARRLAGDGFAALKKQVSDSLGLSEPAGDRAIARFGVAADPPADPTARAVNSALRTPLRNLAQEVRRTLEHVGSKLKSRPPERLVVMGAGGAIPGLPEALGHAAGVSAEPWCPAGLEFADASLPPCLFAQAIALSALAWAAEGRR